MKNATQAEPSAWSPAEEVHEGTDLGSLHTLVTKKAPSGVMKRAVIINPLISSSWKSLAVLLNFTFSLCLSNQLRKATSSMSALDPKTSTKDKQLSWQKPP